MVKNNDKHLSIDKDGHLKHLMKQAKIGNGNSSTIEAHVHRDSNGNVTLLINSMTEKLQN